MQRLQKLWKTLQLLAFWKQRFKEYLLERSYGQLRLPLILLQRLHSFSHLLHTILSSVLKYFSGYCGALWMSMVRAESLSKRVPDASTVRIHFTSWSPRLSAIGSFAFSYWLEPQIYHAPISFCSLLVLFAEVFCTHANFNIVCGEYLCI